MSSRSFKMSSRSFRGGGKGSGRMSGFSDLDGTSQEQSSMQEWQQTALRLLAFPPLMVHVALVLMVGWIVSSLELNVPFFFTLGLLYLCYIESRQRRKVEMRIRSDERKLNDRKRLLSDLETARWLNNVLESIWSIFLERFVSQHLLMRLAPWFLEKFKPWTAKKVVLQSFYMGSSPPVFTHFRAGRNPTDGDHLVLEMSMNFTAASDMVATVGVQMRKRLGFGMWTSIKVSELQIEGRVKIGVRFTKGWPVIKRLRICFSEAPVIRMAAKPIFNHGVDVTDLPGIAAWLDKMVIDALEQSLVEPNLLVVDVEKLAGDLIPANWTAQTGVCPKTQDWFHLGKQGTVATLVVEILEGEKLKACDPNGKSDPYVKVMLGPHSFQTPIMRKTLSPKWHESFHIPIESWSTENKLLLKVRDKDRFVDDDMGFKNIDVKDYRDGIRHDMWLRLDGVKTGQLHVGITVEELPGMEDDVADSGPLVADSLREIPEYAEPDSDEMMDDDSDDLPTNCEYEDVDVGIGKACVSIVNPGKHVVNEKYSTERLQQRSASRRSLSRKPGELSKSGRQREGLECVDPASPDSVSEAKHSRLGNFWGRRSRKNNIGEVEDVELEGRGKKGTQLHTDLKIDDSNVDLSRTESVPEVKHSRISNLLGRRSKVVKRKGVVADDDGSGDSQEDVGELTLQGSTGTKVQTNLKMSEDDIDALQDEDVENEQDVGKRHRLRVGRENLMQKGKDAIHGRKKSSPAKSDDESTPTTQVAPMETSSSFNKRAI